MHNTLLTAVGALCAIALIQADAPAQRETSSPDIGKLIKQLGSDDFAERESAQVKLKAIGEPALEPLRKAVAATDDAEVKHRANELIQSLVTKQLGEETAKLQGVWKLAYVGERGNGTAASEDGSFQITFTDKEYVWKGSGFLSFVDSAGPFVLGNQRGTKTLDLRAAHRPPMLAVYDVEGDLLKVCVDIVQERHRPERLAPGNSQQLLLLTFQREKR